MQHLLLLHGAIGAKDQFEPLLQQVKDDFIVHTLDFSGHGGTAFSENFTIPQFAGEVVAYLQQNLVPQVNIFGFSMGGYVAMYLAKNYPSAVKRIITLATKFYWNNEIAQKEAKMLNTEVISEKLPHFAKQMERRHFPNDWKLVLEKTMQMLIQLGTNNVLTLKDYAVITQPCLLLLGDKDNMVTMEETIAVAHTLPAGEFKLLPDISHPIEKVNTTLLGTEIKSFLK